MNSDCNHLYFLSTIACQLSNCLSKTELEILAADLVALGDLIEALQAHRSACRDE